MAIYFDRKLLCRIWSAIGMLCFCGFMPIAAYARNSALPTCEALISVSNNLYLVDHTGTMITQFTSYAITEHDAVLSPDGNKVAYISGSNDTDTYAFTVVDKYGRQGTSSVSPSSQHETKNDPTFGLGANNPIEGLSWNSRDLLRVTKWAGKDVARFEFYRIPHDLSHSAHEVAEPVLEENCIAERYTDSVACIEREGTITLNRGADDGNDIFSITGFEGIAPYESFTIHVGDSVTPPNGPPFTINIKSIANNKITLRLTPTATGIWGEMQIDNGSYMPEDDYSTGDVYGFYATIVNAETGLVRIAVVKSNSPSNIFDPALAWTPHGHGLLLIRRTNSQAILYLIRPGRGHDHEDEHSADEHGRQWHLAAQAPINLPTVIQDIRFATPSLLLLKTADGAYSEVAIDIQHGHHDHGSENQTTLTLGPVTPLPATLPVTLNGATTQAKVLGWSCGTARHDHDDDDD
ncbi:MAG TPA: hypothetical protein VFM15_08945 [Gammaproteobacteria bacterium]|nr:hypothetical protein [Gammaproteobacteria bacterium]